MRRRLHDTLRIQVYDKMLSEVSIQMKVKPDLDIPERLK